MGPLGSAKTTGVVWELLFLSCQQMPDSNGVRKTVWVVVRNTQSDLLTTTIPTWREITEPNELTAGQSLGNFSLGPPPVHKLRFPLPDGTLVQSDVWFLSMDNWADVRRLRGFNVTGAWLNEGKELIKAIWDMADGRAGRYPETIRDPATGEITYGPSWYGVLSDSNAWSEASHLMKWYEDWRSGKMPDWEFFIQPGGVKKYDGLWVPNPDAENLANLPDSYYDRQMQGKSEDWIAVNLGNEFGSTLEGKPVYPEFSEQLHVDDGILRLDNNVVTVGLDFGLTPAAVFMQNHMGRTYVHDEIITTNMAAKQFARLVKNELARHYPNCRADPVGDPAGDARAQTDEQTVFNVLRDAGLMARKAPTNDFVKRREAGAKLLTRIVDGKAACLIHPRCRQLREGLRGGYHYRRLQTREDRYTDRPEKNESSHVTEAFIYGIMGAGEGYLEHTNQWQEKYKGRTPSYQGAQPFDVFKV